MTRQTDLAKIHIARKDLHLDDDLYRQIVREIGGAESGSSKDLTPTGCARLLAHFQQLGWKPRPGKKKAAGATQAASGDLISLIPRIWTALVDAGVVHTADPAALRTWLRSNTRRYHPQKAGWEEARFLPKPVAIKVVESLKQWAKRCGVKWR